jgi:hypothetical protein
MSNLIDEFIGFGKSEAVLHRAASVNRNSEFDVSQLKVL